MSSSNRTCRFVLRKAFALFLIIPIAVAVFAAACGDDTTASPPEPPSGVAAFDPARADALAHAALPQAKDLPGSWPAGAIDPPASDTSALDQLMAAEPACAGLAKLSAIALLFGGLPAAKADAALAVVNFSREPAKGVLFPTSVQVEVEIKNSLAESDYSWKLTKQAIESDDAKQCLTKVLPAYITKGDDSGRAAAAFQPATPTVKPPHNGVAIAFTLQLKIDGIVADGVMELYFWPYSNAALSTFFLGGRSELTTGVLSGTMKAVDTHTAAAAKTK